MEPHDLVSGSCYPLSEDAMHLEWPGAVCSNTNKSTSDSCLTVHAAKRVSDAQDYLFS